MVHDHTDRERAGSFGRDAGQYDRARPDYPGQLVRDLVELAAATPAGDAGAGRPPEVLDIACGTGKAARALVAAGCRVLGVELDERMAAVARASGLRVEVAPVESWDPAGRRFDLVTCGQAWHWVDPASVPAKTAAVLRAGGHLVAFWNYRDPPADAGEAAAITAVYRREAPTLVPARGEVGVADHEAETAQHVAELEASGCFAPCEVRYYRWQEQLPLDRYLERLETHSEHRLLGDGRRARLLAGLRAVLERRGETVELAYTTHCIVAPRR